MSTPFCLLLPRQIHEGMMAQAIAELPNECCGLLAGTIEDSQTGDRIGRVVQRYPLVNVTASPKEFWSEPKGMFAAARDMRQRGLDVLAIYHSHPTSAPVPSRTDLERNYSPDVINLIISLISGEPDVRAWWLTEQDYREAEWEVR